MKRRGNNEGSICKRKNGTWVGAISLGRDPATGKPKRAYFSGRTRAEVAEKINAALGSLRQGTFAAPAKITFGEWLETWLREYKRPALRPSTYDSYEILVNAHIKPVLGHLLLRDLRPEHLQRLYNEKAKSGRRRKRPKGPSGLSPTTIRYIHAIVHGALEQAMKNGLVARNVSEATTLPRQEKREIRPLTQEQVGKLFEAIEGDRLFAAIYLEISTGLRRGELLGLKWEDVDLEAGTLTVKRSLMRVRDREGGGKTRLVFAEPKTRAAKRTVPIPEDALAELKRWKVRQAQEKLAVGEAYEDNGLVFCTETGAPLEPRNFTRRFEAMLSRAGLPKIRFHDARHTFATLHLEIGEHPKVVQEMLGHSRISMTLDTYSHVSLDLERRAAARLNEVLRDLRKKKALRAER